MISHNVKNGKTYRIIFHSLNGWKPGDLINVLRVSGDHFIRIDKKQSRPRFFGVNTSVLALFNAKIKN